MSHKYDSNKHGHCKDEGKVFASKLPSTKRVLIFTVTGFNIAVVSGNMAVNDRSVTLTQGVVI